MSESDLYNGVPYHDPELAFVELERRLREECEQNMTSAGPDDRTDIFFVDYIGQVMTVASELGLSPEFILKTPEPDLKTTSYTDYLNFRKEVKIYCTTLAIRKARRDHKYSVKLDAAAKQKLRHYLTQIKEIVDKLDVEPKKRDALYTRISDLEAEIDRERMRWDTFAAVSIASAGVFGKMVDKSRVIELLDAIAGVLWGAQRDEQTRLPGPKEPRRIEGPREAPSQKAKGSASKLDLDDEIPF